MNVDDLVAIDIHTHAEVSTRILPDEAEAEALEARGKYFRYEVKHPTIAQMADYYRSRKMAFVVFTVFEYIFAPEQAEECLPIYDELAQLTLIGHSHLCKVFALTPDAVEELPAEDFILDPTRKYIVSVGSIGQPRDCDNRASYTVYDSETRRFTFRRIEYDVEAAAEKILGAKLERNFAHRLFLGV